MLKRYSRPKMAAVWSQEEKLRLWLEIECLACEGQAAFGHIPQEAAALIRKRGVVDIARIEALEEESRHDVIAFLMSLSERIGEPSRFLHQGMTSSDVLDTCFALQLRRSADILLEGVDGVLAALRFQALRHRETLCMGRSHGMFGEPVTFGFKMAQGWAEFRRQRERLLVARREISTCAISGAMGLYAHIDPRVERYVAEKLGLAVEPLSTQVIPRDRHGAFFAALALLASSVERVAVELRHLQRSEVGEVCEPFGVGQKGSSAMPHKRNPILGENLTGLARLVRGYVVPALENVALWHERDISHSAVERVAAPDATIALDFALSRLAHVLQGLEVDGERMLKNVESALGLWGSGAVLHGLTSRGMGRDEAYGHVQGAAMRAVREGRHLLEVLRGEGAVVACFGGDGGALAELFRPERYVGRVGEVFERLFGREAGCR